MKDSNFWHLFRRDVQNYFRINRFLILIAIGLFLIGAMTADSQLSTQGSKYGVTDYFIMLFRGSYPFSETQNGMFELPLTWFILIYFCVYTALIYPAQEQNGISSPYLVRAKSRTLWWLCKCFSLVVWVAFYFFLGLACLLGFMIFSGYPPYFSSTLVPDQTACAALCGLPILFTALLASFCLCCCMLFNFWIAQAAAVVILILIAFVQIPYFPGNYSMLIRCRILTPGGLKESPGILLHVILIALLWAAGSLYFQKTDILPKKKGDINEN
ncbi:MAG TPA: hypothetical protein H9698_02165 [Candidatus Ruthenibacterium merdavium]|uniref:Uncharacterized protein n=1 Tax=Candidatus Ruthenibacterium merdavium TaxID=2838752 RepID=A0A9D2Q523_9FIRM|nr:hypothetical protein [Candidatus Ruthenibacterium merdavium]